MKSEFHDDRFFMPRTKHFLGHTGFKSNLWYFQHLHRGGTVWCLAPESEWIPCWIQLDAEDWEKEWSCQRLF